MADPAMALTPLSGGAVSSLAQSSGARTALPIMRSSATTVPDVQILPKKTIVEKTLVQDASSFQKQTVSEAPSSARGKLQPSGSLQGLVAALTADREASSSKASTYSAAVQKFVAGMPSSVLEQLKSQYDIAGSSKLGYGRHSDVIQARSKVGGTDVAVKVLALSEISELKVRREVSAMAEFTHQYCARMVDAVQCSEQLPNVKRKPPYVCIVMKHIADAEALSNMIRRSGANQMLAWRVLWHVASALLEMHKHGLVHRDVWSENVLVDSSLNSYLIDFGCTESSRKPSGLQIDAGLNIPYLSPQVSKKDPPSPSEDMWALGLVLTEVVTGRHIIFRMGRHDIPFYTQSDLLQNALEETVSQGGTVLGQICKRLLEPNATTRATAAEVLSMFGLPTGGVPARYQTQTRSQGSALTGSALVPGSSYTGKGSLDTQKPSAPAPKPSNNGTDIAAGRQVIYQASSHNASYLATVLGRSSGKNAWTIQLTGGGMKDVPDAEVWRLTPQKAGQSQSATSTQVSQSATPSQVGPIPKLSSMISWTPDGKTVTRTTTTLDSFRGQDKTTVTKATITKAAETRDHYQITKATPETTMTKATITKAAPEITIGTITKAPDMSTVTKAWGSSVTTITTTY